MDLSNNDRSHPATFFFFFFFAPHPQHCATSSKKSAFTFYNHPHVDICRVCCFSWFLCFLSVEDHESCRLPLCCSTGDDGEVVQFTVWYLQQCSCEIYNIVIPGTMDHHFSFVSVLEPKQGPFVPATFPSLHKSINALSVCLHLFCPRPPPAAPCCSFSFCSPPSLNALHITVT